MIKDCSFNVYKINVSHFYLSLKEILGHFSYNIMTVKVILFLVVLKKDYF